MITNPMLEARLDAVRDSLDALSAVVDENLRTVLRRLTCDEAVFAHGALQPIAEQARNARERCLLLVARQQPIASDLKYAMSALRVGHDYERIQELANSLNTRVERLRGSPIQEIIQDMTGVMADILELHVVVRRTWQRDRADQRLPNLKPEVARLASAVHSGVIKIQTATMDAISKGQGSPELLVELVLACRHLKRIANMMEAIPEELHSFD